MNVNNNKIGSNNEAKKSMTRENLMNRNEYGMSLKPVLLNSIKRKIDPNVVKFVTVHKKARFDSLLSKMERISEVVQLAVEPSENGLLPKFTKSPDYIVNGQMRGYQITGLNWMIALHEHGLSGILADEMGLGKTLQAIALLGYLQLVQKVDGKFLIVVPLTTITNWENEFNQWCPTLKVVALYGSENIRRQVINGVLNDESYEWDVCLTTYEMCKLTYTRQFINRFRWYYIILDEGTRIKNEETHLAQAVRTLKSKYRLILTGTPLNNNLHELWALLSFLMPNEFVSSIEFDVWFDDDACLANEKTPLNNLHTILKAILLRRLKSDVEKIKPYKDVDVFVNITHLQREWYRKILVKNIEIVHGSGVVKLAPLQSMFVQLRKCTNHPYLFEGAETGPPFVDGDHIVNNSGKMVVLSMLLAKLKQQKSRVLVFSQFTKVLDIIEDYLNLHPEYEYCRLDGSLSIDERTDRIKEFQNPQSNKFIFLLSTRSGGMGINLTGADSVIIYDSDWNPQMDLQAISRSHRIGQTKEVRVFRLIVKDTVDEKIIERANMKLRLSDLVIESHVKSRSEVSKKFLLNAVRFGADAILSNGSSLDGVEWDKLVQENSQKLVDQIFEN